MALPKPPSITSQIPNQTFYSAPSWNLVAPQGPLIVGDGLEVVPEEGTVVAIPQVVGVNSILAGVGISVNQPDGDVTITNTGVTNIQAGPNIAVSANNGSVVVTAILPAYVAQIIGTPPVTVSGNAVSPILSVTPASTSASGVVQLYNDTNSTSDSLALTAAQGKYLQDQISALVLSSSNLLFAGTINASTGLLTAVTPEGTNEGFAVGSPLPSPVLTNTGYFVIVTISGTFTPTGGSTPFVATKGDWLVSSGTNWDFLDVGFDADLATTTDAGIVKLSTDAETQTGTADNVAVTPASLQSKVSSSTSLASSSSIASSLAVKDAFDLADEAIPKSFLTTKGAILSTNTPGQPFTVVPVQDGYYLQSDIASPGGVKWAPTGTVCTVSTGTGLTGGPITTTGTIALAPSGVSPAIYSYPASLNVDSYGRIVNAVGGENPVTTDNFTALGSIVAGTGANTFGTLLSGSNNQILAVDTGCPTGLKWVPSCVGTVTTVNTGVGLTGGPVTSIGTICLADTTVIPGSYPNACICVDQQGRITSIAQGGVGITSLLTGPGLIGGPITSSGTIDLSNTTVIPGTYTNATVTVDAKGRVTSAVSGSGGGGGGGAPAYAQTALTVPVGFPETQVDGIIMTVSISTSGNPVTVMASGTAQGCEGTGIGCVSIQRLDDGTNQSPQWIEATRFMDQTFAISHVEKPAAGVHTYALVYNSAVGVAECGMCFGASGACGPILSAFEIGGGGQVNAIECTTLTAKGDLIVASAVATPTALPIGSPGDILTVAPSGTALEYANWGTWQSGSVDVVDGNGIARCAGTFFDCQWYRQTGPDSWEVCVSACNNGVSSDGGSGSYCILLPAGLCFNTAPGYGQQPYSGTNALVYHQRSIPSWGSFGNGSTFNSTQNNLGVIPQSIASAFNDVSCRYRVVFCSTTDNTLCAWSSTWFQFSNPVISANYCFTFRSA